MPFSSLLKIRACMAATAVLFSIGDAYANGGVTVYIAPESIRDLARWQLYHAAPLMSSGQTYYESVDPRGDNYNIWTIIFSPIPGWLTPPATHVVLREGQVSQLNVNYTQIYSALRVDIEPVAARQMGAQWRLTSGPDTNWKMSYDVIPNIPSGLYKIQFSDLDGWDKPDEIDVLLTRGGDPTLVIPRYSYATPVSHEFLGFQAPNLFSVKTRFTVPKGLSLLSLAASPSLPSYAGISSVESEIETELLDNNILFTGEISTNQVEFVYHVLIEDGAPDFLLPVSFDYHLDDNPDAYNKSLSPLLVGDPSAIDSDVDDLTDLEEWQLGTDPNNWDTDGDGLSDGFEVESDFDPLMPVRKTPLYADPTIDRLAMGVIGRIQNISVADVKVVNGLAYVASTTSTGTGMGLAIYDVSDPTAIALLGTYVNTYGFRRLVVESGFAYCIGAGIFEIISVADPANPVLIASVNIPSSTKRGIVKRGSYCYVTTNASGAENALHVIDVSNPYSPSIVAGRSLSGASFGDSSIDANYLFIGAGRVYVYQITNPIQPQYLLWREDFGYVNRLTTHSGKAYISIQDYGLKIIDISTPSSMQIIASLPISMASIVEIAYGSVYVSNSLAFVSGKDDLAVVRVANPSSPSLLSVINFGTDSSPSVGSVIGNHAFVGTKTKGLYVYDLAYDSDNDHLPDAWELVHFGSIVLHNGDDDPDQDAVKNITEYIIGSDSLKRDTDGDGFTDGFELRNSLNPVVPSGSRLAYQVDVSVQPTISNDYVEWRVITSTDHSWRSVDTPASVPNGMHEFEFRTTTNSWFLTDANLSVDVTAATTVTNSLVAGVKISGMINWEDKSTGQVIVSINNTESDQRITITPTGTFVSDWLRPNISTHVSAFLDLNMNGHQDVAEPVGTSTPSPTFFANSTSNLIIHLQYPDTDGNGIDDFTELYIIGTDPTNAADPIFVDANSSADPGPGTPDISSPYENGSYRYPFDSLQKAIDAAGSGATILMRSGMYAGVGNHTIDIKDKSISVHVIDPEPAVLSIPPSAPGVVVRIGTNDFVKLKGIKIRHDHINQ